MIFKAITQKVLCCALFATSVLSANAADRLLIVGNAVRGGYSIDNSIAMLNSADAPNVFKTTAYLKGTEEFKFLTTTNWGGLEYRAGEQSVTLALGVEGKLVSSEENGNDNKFFVSESANYDIVCDLQQKTIVVTLASFQSAPIYYPNLWLVGDATLGGWSIPDGFRMTQDDSNPLKFTANVNLVAGEFKFAINNQTGYGQTFYVRDLAVEDKMVFGGDDNKWSIAEDGKYDIAVDLSTLSISISQQIPSSISQSILTSGDSTSEFYNLNGIKVRGMAKKGILINRKNGKSVKVLVR